MAGGYLKKKRNRKLALLLILALSGTVSSNCTNVQAESFKEEGVQEEDVQAGDVQTGGMKEDHTAPSFSLVSVKNNRDLTSMDEAGSYYFQDDLSVRLSITEEVLDGGMQTPVIIRRNGSVILEVKEGESLSDFTDTIRESGEYVYTIEDISGNVNDTKIIVNAVQAFSEPDMELICENSAASVDGIHYLNCEPELMVNISDALGIARIAYREEDDTYRIVKDYGSGDIYKAGENLSFEGAIDILDDTLNENFQPVEEGTYHYAFQVTNVLGNTVEKEVELVIDRTSPDPAVFVSYETDGTNQETVPQADTGIMDFLNAEIDRLFGKSQIRFHLYVRDGSVYGQNSDGVSGIDTEDILSHIIPAEGNASIRELKIAKEDCAFVCNGKEYEGYTHIQGIFAFSPEDRKDTSDRILITRIKDRAGNMIEKINAEDISGSVILYLDRKAPMLHVDYKNGRVDHTEGKGRIFCAEDAKVELGLMENCYHLQTDEEGDQVSPTVTVVKNGQTDTRIWIEEWTFPSDGEAGGYEVCADICFPVPDSKDEAEYEFMVNYQDASGNQLTMADGCMGKVSEGVFTSCPIIVDSRPPELTAFSLEGKSDHQIDGIHVYQNQKDNDVILTFTVDDHEDYWNPEEIKLSVYSRNTKKIVLQTDGTAVEWNHDGREHRGRIPFDGSEDMESDSFYVTLSYADRAGNLLENKGVKEGSMDEKTGTYTSPVFILDHKNPVFGITYPAAHRLVRDDDPVSSNDHMGREPLDGYTAYYNESIAVEFFVEEASGIPIYEKGILKGLMDFKLSVKGRNGKLYEPEVSWSMQENVYKGTLVLEAEDAYTIMAEYEDAAGNGLEGGNYRSMNLVLDRTAPVIRISYTDTAFHEITAENVFSGTGRKYFSQPLYLKLTVDDQNIRYQELKDQLLGIKLQDREGNIIEDSDAKHFLDQIDGSRIEREGFTWHVPFTTEANYDLFLVCEDLSGNEAKSLSEILCVDHTQPEMELSYEIQKSGFLDAVRYGDINYLFASEKLEIHASAGDSISGIRSIRYKVTDKEKKEQEKIMCFDPSASASYSVTIPLSQADFNGLIQAEVLDWSGNRSEKTNGHIIESRERHENAGSAVITTYTAPGRIVGGEAYYNTDVHLNLTLKDEYSGLRKVSYSGGNTLSGSKDYAAEAQEKKTGNDMVFSYSEDLILKASVNNENDICVRAELMDNTGHTASVEQFYHIDITAPVITVEYDRKEPVNGRFYNQARTATVTIRERNFDERDVDFQITSSEGRMPVIGSFCTSGAGDDTLHVCQVVFEEDGDYTFSVSFVDKAGNRAEYGQVDEFTIDRTAPVLTVTYDNDQRENDFYYAEKRTAVIDVAERNFDSALLEIVMTKDGEEFPLVSVWSKDGEHNRTYVPFNEDARYTISIRGQDQAGNLIDEYGTDTFVIDQTPPFLEIFGVRDQSANPGAVMPGVRWADENGDPNRVNILLKGCQRGIQKMDGDWKRTEQGMEFQMYDFPYEPDSDDLYIMEAVVSDLAGNQSEAQIIFSVNRFGSVYTFDEKTASLAGEQGSYYTKQEQDIVVTETNVDTLEFHEITCSQNGELRTLAKEDDYVLGVSETENRWKQYTYTVDKKNFMEEGAYILTIYSEDRAGNRSDNHTKGKEIAFVIDKTAPEILISGLKDGGQYREKYRDVVLDVQDNTCIGEVKVILNGEKKIYSADEIIGCGGRITIRIGDSSRWQTMRVLAVDRAGNEQQSEELRFLITSDLFIQLLRTQLLLPGMIGILSLSAAGWFRKRWRSREGRT